MSTYTCKQPEHTNLNTAGKDFDDFFESDSKKYDIHYRHRKYNVILTPAIIWSQQNSENLVCYDF